MSQVTNIVFSPAAILILGLLMLVPFAKGSANGFDNALVDSEYEYNMIPHDTDLSRIYLSEYKRLPVYDFGLGKRSDLGQNGKALREYDDYSYSDDDDDSLPELELYHDENMQSVEKRQRPYNFGLGKRQRYDFGLGKRGRGYDFGLGKRGNEAFHPRDRLYSMGLGKRNRLYSFGLGKRPYSPSSVASRFNFGLGKRSDNYDASKNVIAKREVQENNGEKQKSSMGRIPDGDKMKSEKINKTSGPDTIQDVHKNPDSTHLFKRSYSYGAMNNPDYRSSMGFSRQFRKPLYNFGLGKRTSLSYEIPLDKINSLNN